MCIKLRRFTHIIDLPWLYATILSQELRWTIPGKFAFRIHMSDKEKMITI